MRPATRMVAEPAGSVMYSKPPDRLEWTGSYGTIQRNRDGVPMWNGDPTLLEEFAEACLRYEQTVVREKRYLCGPRIASELSGPAKRVLLGRPADWLSFDGGVRRLLEELRVGRGQPKVPEMSELLMKYFKGTKRTKGEGMSDYVTRKAEAYTRAQQSMARYLQEQKSGASWNTRPQSSWNTGHSQNMGSSVTVEPDLQDPTGDDEDRWEAYSQAGSAAARGAEAASQDQVPEEIKDLRCPGGVSKVGMITPSSDPGQTTVAGIAVKLPTIPQSGDGVSCQRLSRRLCRDGTFS